MQILGRDVILSLIIVGCILFVSTHRKKERHVTFYHIGVLLYSLTVVTIFSLTGVSPLSGFHTELRMDDISLIPFAGIADLLKGGINLHAIINIFGNIVMFMPIGFFVPFLWSNLRKLGKLTLFGFLVSLLIETSQLFLSRGTDIDDLILNTLGTILGYFAFLIFQKMFSSLSFKLQEEARRMESMTVFFSCHIVPYAVIVLCGFYDRSLLFHPR